MSTLVAASAIVLAGGRSSRMGQAKASLDFGGVPILTRIVTELKKRFAEIVVVADPESIVSLEVTLVRDETPFQGPSDALRRGLDAATKDAAFACSCDLPLLNSDVAASIVAMLADYDAAIPVIGERLQPLHAAYLKRCAAALASMAASG